MLERKPIFPNVIEMNHQVRRVLGCNVYLVYDQAEWILVDIGYEDSVSEIVELIRELDFPLSKCKTIVATHADADHIQGLAKAKQILRTTITAHRMAVPILEEPDRIQSFAEIKAQGIDLDMSPVGVEHAVDEGDTISVGGLQLQVWTTPGHTNNQIALRLGDLLLSGDNIYRDGCVGAIDAHHGSDIPSFMESLHRIQQSDVQWLLPAHGPYFRKDDQLLQQAIERLDRYQHMADFGTCAVDWPLLDEWEDELTQGPSPN